MKVFDLLNEQRETNDVVDGYKFAQYEEKEEDNRKIFHEVTPPQGKTHYLDWTPYEWLSREDMENIVRFHKRIGRFPSRKDAQGHSLDSKTMKNIIVQQDPELTSKAMKKHFGKDERYGPYGE